MPEVTKSNVFKGKTKNKQDESPNKEHKVMSTQKPLKNPNETEKKNGY